MAYEINSENEVVQVDNATVKGFYFKYIFKDDKVNLHINIEFLDIYTNDIIVDSHVSYTQGDNLFMPWYAWKIDGSGADMSSLTTDKNFQNILIRSRTSENVYILMQDKNISPNVILKELNK